MTSSPVSAKPAINPALMRQVRSGKSAGITARPVAATSYEEQPSSIDLTDDHPAAASISEPIDPTENSIEDIEEELAIAAPAKTSRFGRFASPVTRRESKESVTDDQEIETKTSATENKSRFGASSAPTQTKQAKVNMAAVKALTPLVAAISFNPGSRSEPAMKSKALAELVCKVQESTTDIALVMGPYFANNEWARGQIMITLAGVAAQQWEKYGSVNLEHIGSCMGGAFREPSAEIVSALESFDADDNYKAADTSEIARARLSVTICAAAWEINDWVTHERLHLKGSSTEKFSNGDSFPAPSRVFGYGLQTAEIVSILLARIIDESRAFEMQIQDADMRLAHLQGTVRRMSQIAGAEYVTQTAAIFQWINDASNEEEQAKRQQMAQDQFHTHLVPRVMEWTRASFASVEHGAQRILMEMTQEKTNATKNREETR